MGDSRANGLRAAWARATQRDILAALREVADYPVEVRRIIEEEAARRGLTNAEDDVSTAPPGAVLLLRSGRAVAQFFAARREAPGLALGVGLTCLAWYCPPGTLGAIPEIREVIFGLLGVAGLSACALPLNSQRLLGRAGFAAWTGAVAVLLVHLSWTSEFAWARIAFSPVAADLARYWIMVWLTVSALVWGRTRFEAYVLKSREGVTSLHELPTLPNAAGVCADAVATRPSGPDSLQLGADRPERNAGELADPEHEAQCRPGERK